MDQAVPLWRPVQQEHGGQTLPVTRARGIHFTGREGRWGQACGHGCRYRLGREPRLEFAQRPRGSTERTRCSIAQAVWYELTSSARCRLCAEMPSFWVANSQQAVNHAGPPGSSAPNGAEPSEAHTPNPHAGQISAGEARRREARSLNLDRYTYPHLGSHGRHLVADRQSYLSRAFREGPKVPKPSDLDPSE